MKTPRTMVLRRRHATAAVVVTALCTAWAPPASAMDVEDEFHQELGPGEDPALREEAQRRLRTYRAIALAEHLDLDEEQALAMNAIISRYDEERRRVRAELAGHMRVLRGAAREREPDAEQVAGAVAGVLAARAKLEKLRQDEARELLEGLDPARQARLLIFFGEFPREVRRLMHEGRHRHRERRGEPGRPPPGPRRP